MGGHALRDGVPQLGAQGRRVRECAKRRERKTRREGRGLGGVHASHPRPVGERGDAFFEVRVQGRPRSDVEPDLPVKTRPTMRERTSLGERHLLAGQGHREQGLFRDLEPRQHLVQDSGHRRVCVTHVEGRCAVPHPPAPVSEIPDAGATFRTTKRDRLSVGARREVVVRRQPAGVEKPVRHGGAQISGALRVLFDELHGLGRCLDEHPLQQRAHIRARLGLFVQRGTVLDHVLEVVASPRKPVVGNRLHLGCDVVARKTEASPDAIEQAHG